MHGAKVKTVSIIAQSTCRMYSVMAIFKSWIVYSNRLVHRDFLITLYFVFFFLRITFFLFSYFLSLSLPFCRPFLTFSFQPTAIFMSFLILCLTECRPVCFKVLSVRARVFSFHHGPSTVIPSQGMASGPSVNAAIRWEVNVVTYWIQYLFSFVINFPFNK
jgi:hypothetical protein